MDLGFPRDIVVTSTPTLPGTIGAETPETTTDAEARG
jgi:hypothetical protein